MKKIIVLLVVFALFAGSAFAVDLGGEVFGSATLLGGSSIKDSPVTASADLTRVRIEGAGQNDEGTFGAWLRMQGSDVGANGLVWWKPLDMLKITIGSNPDNHWGVDNIVGWNFSQMAYEVNVAMNSPNIWGEGIYKTDATGNDWGAGWNKNSRKAFFGGWNAGWSALMLEITPMDVFNINVGFNLDGKEWGGKEEEGTKKYIEGIFDSVVAQVNLNLAFGGIHLTYTGEGEKAGKLYGSVDLSAIDNVGLNIGVGLPFDSKDKAPKQVIWAGLGVKVGISDLFGIKLRTWAGFGGEDSDPFLLNVDVMPYLTLSDSLRVFFDLGLGMASYDKTPYTGANRDEKSVVGFHVNPYIQVGQEWGPAFFAGFFLKDNGWKEFGDGGKDSISLWGVNVGIICAF